MLLVGCFLGFNIEFVGMDCIVELYLFYNFDGVFGVLYMLDDGYVDLINVIMVMVVGVWVKGVKIICCCQVINIIKQGYEWVVEIN